MRELIREFVVIDLRAKDEYDRDITLAWHIAVLSRQRRVPDRKTLLAFRGRRDTLKRQRESVEVLSSQTGFPMRRVKRIVRE